MSHQTLVKICGLNDSNSVDAAIAAGADMLGLVFFEKSPRNLSLEAAGTLAKKIRAAVRPVDVVALLVNPTNAALDPVMQTVRPDFVQLHGKETPARVEWIQNAHNVRVIKAIGVATQDDVDQAAVYDGVANRILFDAKPPPDAVLPGGNGLSFDWTILKTVPAGGRYMLSGGLTPENVGEAVRLTGAPAVDVSSGVESAPGTKDPELIGRFIAAAKAATKSSMGA